MRKLLLVLALAAVFCSIESAAQDNIEVKVFLDRNSGGWNDKKSDYAFFAEVNGCRIKWNAVEEKDGTRSLVLHRTCNIPFSQQADIHLAILKQINARWEIGSFKYINWGSFCNKNDWSWCIPIAEASLQSKEFIDHCKKYPENIETVSTNHLFIKLANQTNSYKPLSDIFREFGVNIKLRTVQKVFALKLKETPFYDQLRNLKIKGNPMVMYDAGMTYFYINN
jgi:hypothetical protein